MRKTNNIKQKEIVKPLFPKHQIFLDKDDKQTYHLVYDGLDGVPIPFRLVLTDIGESMIETALTNMPVYISHRQFWGYNGLPRLLVEGEKNVLIGGYPKEGTLYISLASKDEMALVAIADLLSDSRCWKDSSNQ